MKKRIYAVLLMLCVLISSAFVFSACTESEIIGVVSASINENGELILTYHDGTEQNLGSVVGKDGNDGQNGKDGETGKAGADGADGSYIISGEESRIPVATAKGLRSAVSISCGFTKTVQTSGYRPGSASTYTYSYASEGSGVIYKLDRASGDAFIVTNYHVVYDAGSNSDNGISEDIKVYLYGSENTDSGITASYVGGSLYYDIAVLKINGSEELKSSDACAATVADSDAVTVGETAIAIGNAQGYGISASVGVISVDSEYITMTAADESTTVSFRVMRVDTAVNSGNSGGGLYNGKGELIGIVNAKIVDDGVENIGYAIPSSVAVAVADNIIDYCNGTDVERAQRAMLGITVTSSGSKAVYDAETGYVRIEETVSVYEVSDGSLADGKLQAGDIIVSAEVNGKTVTVTRQYHVIDLMLGVRVGDTVSIKVKRSESGETAEKTVDIVITADCITEY